MISFINRKQMYLFERLYRYISIPLVKKLSETKISPNMITIFNFIVAIINSYLLIINKFNVISAILILVYYFLDVVDGNLARCTGKTSTLGKNLDAVGDHIFYNIFLILIGANKVSLTILVIVLLLHNFYSIITTFYIAPSVRKISDFKRGKLKKYLMDNGIILGVDLSLIGILLVIALISKAYVVIYSVIISLYIIDTIYRLVELKINQSIAIDNKSERK